MNSHTPPKIAGVQDRIDAFKDRLNYNNPSIVRGKQIAFAMVDAAIKNETHPVSFHVASAVKHMKH